MAQNTDLQDHDRPQEYSSKKTKRTPRSKNRYFDIFPEAYNPVSGERAMWVAVITQAMMDALSKSQTIEAKFYRNEAIHWLTENSTHFVMVCQLAGFDPGFIRRRAKKALVTPIPWRLEAGKSSRYLERKAYRARLKKRKQ